MTYDELCEKIEKGDYNEYTDRVDETIEISLIEYGILRNPETTECLFWINDTYNGGLPNDDHKIILKSNDVSIEDVREYLTEDAEDGFFRFIGSSLEKELERLDNNNLAHIIQSINQYDGWFNL